MINPKATIQDKLEQLDDASIKSIVSEFMTHEENIQLILSWPEERLEEHLENLNREDH